MVFASPQLWRGLLMTFEVIPGKLMDSGIYTFARSVAYQITNVYAVSMAGVFMVSIRIRIFPRWMAFSATCWRFSCS